MAVRDDYDRSGTMALFASWFLPRLTLAEATAFVVERRLLDCKGDVLAAAKSLGVDPSEVECWKTQRPRPTVA